MANRTIRTPHAREQFLAALSDGASVTKACEAAKIGRRSSYDWRKADTEFAAEWDSAVERGTDRIEDEALRRAVDGVEKPVGWHQGKAGGTVTEYSDRMLEMLLKARRPQKYAERSINENINRNYYEGLSEEELDKEIERKERILGRTGSEKPAAGQDVSDAVH